LDTFS